jgi:hypothetical protein
MVALSACSGSNSLFGLGTLRSAEVGRDEATLADAVVAFYVSPQAYMNAGDHGWVVLADSAGQVRTIRTSGMDIGALSWTENGLFFADRDNDYLLTKDGLQVVASPKAEYQVALFAIDGKYIALYNDGFTDGGYQENLVVSDGMRSVKTDIEGEYWTVAQCGSQVFAVTPATGPRIGQYRDLEVAGNPAKLLVTLYPEYGTVVGAASVHSSNEASDIVTDAPCSNGVMSLMTTVAEGESGQRPIVRSWNTVTGSQTDADLTVPGGAPLTADDLEVSSTSSDALVDGQLRWVATHGQVMSTDTATGVTRVLFTMETPLDGSYQTAIRFTADSLFALSGSARDLGEDIVLRRYDLATGQAEELVRIPDLNSELWNGVYLRGFAVSPALLAAQ